jgi:hypothetical protein
LPCDAHQPCFAKGAVDGSHRNARLERLFDLVPVHGYGNTPGAPRAYGLLDRFAGWVEQILHIDLGHAPAISRKS